MLLALVSDGLSPTLGETQALENCRPDSRRAGEVQR